MVLDQQRVPVWGREDDAADKLPGFLMLQFPDDTAHKLMNGAAFLLRSICTEPGSSRA